jgi:hypothetical protein
VTFEADIKAETLFTENDSSSFCFITLVFTSAGSLTAFDSVYSLCKVQFYQEFDPNTCVFTFQKRDESWSI